MHFTTLLLLPSVLALPATLVDRAVKTTTQFSAITTRDESSGCSAPAACEGNTWSRCSNNAMVPMGELAAGQSCADLMALFNGSQKREESGCPAPATCEGNSWSMCSNNAMVPMGSIAEGTTCEMLLASFNPPQKRSSTSAKREEANGCPAPVTCEGTSWSRCSNNAMVSMGNIAEGTTCEMLLASFAQA